MWVRTFRNVAARKLRTLATSVSIALGVAFITGSLMFGAALNAVFDDLFAGVFRNVDASIQGPKSDMVGDNGFESTLPFDDRVLSVVRGMPGVMAAEGYINSSIRIVGSDGKPLTTTGAPQQGDYFDGESKMPFWELDTGRVPAQDNEVTVDSKTFEAGKYTLDGPIQVITKTGVHDLKLVGTLKPGPSVSLAGSQFVMFRSLAINQEVNGSVGKVDAVNVRANGGVSQAELVSQIRDRFKQDGEEFSTLQVMTGKEAQDQSSGALKDGLKFITYFVLGFAVIALFVGAFVIHNTFSILFAQRNRESALLRAIGATRRQVLGSQLLETAVVGLVASVLGFVLGIGVAYLIKSLFSAFGMEIPGQGMAIPLSAPIIGILTGVGVTVLAGTLPSVKSSSIPPLAALRDVAFDATHQSKKRFVVATALSVLGVVLVAVAFQTDVPKPFIYAVAGVVLVFLGVAGFGPFFAIPMGKALGAPIRPFLTGRLAQENVARNPRRTSSTAIALLIGVTFVVAVSTLVHSTKQSVVQSVDKSFGADFVVMSTSHMMGSTLGLPPESKEKILAIPGVQGVLAAQDVAVKYGEREQFTQALDDILTKDGPAKVEDFADIGNVAGDPFAMGSDGFCLPEKTAKDLNLSIGSTIEATFATGQSVPLSLRCTYGKTDMMTAALVNGKLLDSLGINRSYGQVMVKLEQGANSEQVEKDLKAVTDPYHVADVMNQADLKDMVVKQFDEMLVMLYAFLALTVVIALFGIGNTLGLSIIERTREIGLLRAVGMTRRQIRRVVGLESVVIAVIGTVQGMALGIIFAYVVVQALRSEGDLLFALPVGQLVAIFALAILAGVLAAAAPARRASRVNMIKAIAEE